MSEWRFVAFGPAKLEGPTSLAPEKKTAAVLLYLALQGPTPRSRLAGLLWPDSSESAARNNLSQTLRRLRLATGAALILGDDVLRTSLELSVDAAELKVQAFAGELSQVLSARGELLDGYDYDDCPEFGDWLYSEREALREQQLRAIEGLARQAEEAGDLAGAVRLSERLLDLDPLSEAYYRQLMTLHYQAGDRPAAIRAYHRCKEVLERELGVEPLPQTKELARKIDQGQVKSAPLKPKREIPLELLRPPVLIGREREWERMEEAWAAGRAIFLSGPSGVGKSRLLRDFALSKGDCLFFEGRPGDLAIPYAAQARFYRDALAARPEAKLEPWVRSELARILPDLGEPPGPIQSVADKLRFFEALASALRELARPSPLLSVVDDLQYLDAASLEAQRYVYGALLGDAESRLRAIFAFGMGELPPEVMAGVAAQVMVGQAVHIELGPLGADATEALLSTLELEHPRDIGQPLQRYTGGNPLFILETVRHLFESEQLNSAFPERLPPPGKAVTVIRRRLEHLSPAALRLAQAAAILQGDLDLGVVAQVLQQNALELISAWEELERQHITSGPRFSHELMLEAVRQVIPEPVKTLLHERAHAVLAQAGAPAAVLAHHAEMAGRLELAFGHRLRAAESAMQVFALASAAQHYRRAHALLQQNSELPGKLEPSALRELYYQLGFIHVYTNAFAEARELYLQGLDLARRAQLPQLEWLVLNHLAYLAVHDGYDLPQASRYAAEALGVARSSGDERLLIEANQEIAGLYTLAFLPDEALRYAEAAREVAARSGDPELLARSLMEVELASWQLGRWEASIELLEGAARLYRSSGNRALEARARHSLAFDQVASGQSRAGQQAALEALRLSRAAPSRREEINAVGVLALALREQGQLDDALRYAKDGVRLAEDLDAAVFRVLALRRLAVVQLDRYDLAGAEAALAEAETLTESLARRPRRGEVLALRCRHAWLRQDPDDAYRYASLALEARDLSEAEPWIERWPLVSALEQAGDAEGLRRASAACQPLRRKSPRHCLELLHSQALGGAEPETALGWLEEAWQLAERLELPQARRRCDLLRAALLTRLERSQEAASCLERADQTAQALAATIADASDRALFLQGAARDTLAARPQRKAA